jgi:hypothetical protein
MNQIDPVVQRAFENYEREQMTHNAAKPVDDRPTERLRAMAQGITFGGADEAEAWARSKLMGEDYDTALRDVRDRLDEYRSARPMESIAYEVGGAALPAIVSGLFTGGTTTAASAARMFPTLAKMAPAARLAGLGAAEGGTYAFLSGEGGFGERASRVPLGVAGGAGGALAAAGAAKAGSAAVGEFLDFAKRRLGDRASKRVERELARVMADNDLSLDDALARIERGEILAEMTPEMADVARGYRMQSRAAATTLGNTYRPTDGVARPDRLRQETMEYIQQRMAPGDDDNVLRMALRNTDEAKALESGEYNRIFAGAPPLADDVVDDLRAALARVPEAGEDVKRIYRAQTGKTPFFEISADGTVTFNRAPTLEDAEIIRRGIRNAKDRTFRTGAGEVGTAYGNVERGLRTRLDDTSGELAATRARWSEIENARDAFEKGQRALGRAPDEIEIEWEAAQRAGDRAIAAYRQGVMHALRRKGSTGSAKSLPRNIANDERREGAILRIVFPEDDLPEMLRRAGVAEASQDAANRIMGGSPTAVTQGRTAEANSSIFSTGLDLAMGNTEGMRRMAMQALKSLKPDLSPQEVTRLAQLMVETRPEVVRAAMTDTTGAQQLMRLGQAILARTTTPAAAGGAVAGAMGATALIP